MLSIPTVRFTYLYIVYKLQITPLPFIVIPIPGSRNKARLDENAKSAEIELDVECVKEIRQLANEADNVAGMRYSEEYIPTGECIKLEEWKGEQA